MSAQPRKTIADSWKRSSIDTARAFPGPGSKPGIFGSAWPIPQRQRTLAKVDIGEATRGGPVTPAENLAVEGLNGLLILRDDFEHHP